MVEPEPEIVTCFEPEFETGCPVPAAFDSHMVYNGDSGDEYKNLGATNGNNLIIVDSTTDTDSASVWVAHFDSLLYLSNFNINASNETSNLN